MEKIPVPKSRAAVKHEISGILKSLDTVKKPVSPTKENIATMDTQDVPQEPRPETRKKPAIKKREMPILTQDVPKEREDIPEVNPDAEEDLPTAEELSDEEDHDGNTEMFVPHKEDFKNAQIEIAENLFHRALMNEDIALAFTQYNLLRTKTKKDTEDYKWQLHNLIKKIAATEKKKYEDGIQSIPPEDPKRLVATRRRALVDSSLKKFQEALEKNIESVELPEDVPERVEDDLPKTVDTSLKVKLHQQTTDAQRDMLPYLFNNALQRKDYLTALNQLWHAKRVAPDMYTEYNSRMLAALEDEITTLEHTITVEKEKTKKTLTQKVWEFFKKPVAEPENPVIKTSEQKIAQFRELKESL